MSTISRLIGCLCLTLPVLILYRILFKNEPLAPKQHFKKYKTLFYTSVFLIIASPLLWNSMYLLAMASGQMRLSKKVPAMDPSYVFGMNLPVFVLYIWSMLEPFILASKMRKIKNHYAELAKAAGSTCSQQPAPVTEKCCSGGGCCKNKNQEDFV